MLERLWAWWAHLRKRLEAARRERAIRLIARAMDTTDWDEYLIRMEAADYAQELLLCTGLAGSEEESEQLAWEVGRRLRQLHQECERRGARAP